MSSCPRVVWVTRSVQFPRSISVRFDPSWPARQRSDPTVARLDFPRFITASIKSLTEFESASGLSNVVEDRWNRLQPWFPIQAKFHAILDIRRYQFRNWKVFISSNRDAVSRAVSRVDTRRCTVRVHIGLSIYVVFDTRIHVYQNMQLSICSYSTYVVWLSTRNEMIEYLNAFTAVICVGGYRWTLIELVPIFYTRVLLLIHPYSTATHSVIDI